MLVAAVGSVTVSLALPRAVPAAHAGTATATATAAGTATALTPLVGDFDGDGRSDVLFYGPGSLPDHLWLGRPDRNFAGVPVSVSGSYQPVLGDFNGDGRTDVFWYAPGSAADWLWLGRAGGAFTTRAASVGGTYQPLVGDFNGDGRDDVLWYGPGSASDWISFGHADGGFAGHPVSVGGTYQPLVGDYNGDGRSDVLWYGAGAAADWLWLGRADGNFASGARTVNGTYQPFTGDFNGDGRTDVFWYGPGSDPDVLWFGRANGTFAGKAAAVNGTYQPLVGDYGGDGPDDVFWYAAGDPDDSLWFGQSSGAFAGRATTLDIGYTRALPLRPETLANQYNPYGFVAHAMGGIDGHTYTNSLEAFQRSYDRGFRVFECDQVLLADGTVLVAHTGLEADYGLSSSFEQATWADLDGHKFLGAYTILRSQDVIQLLKDHPDIYFVLDIKYSNLAIWKTYAQQAGGDRSLIERLLPHVADQAQLNDFRTVYPLQNYVLALYETQWANQMDDPEAVTFVRANRTPRWRCGGAPGTRR